MPVPGPSSNGSPYPPAPILPGGVVVPLYQPGSPFLNLQRVHEAEKYNMRETVPGRIESIVNIHNPSIEFHTADPRSNTGAVVILAAGGGHTTLNVGPEGADFVPFFYTYGVNTVILRSRLRVDGYGVQNDEVRDAHQAIRFGPRLRQAVEHRPEQDRHHGFSRQAGNWPPGRRFCLKILTLRTTRPAMR